MTELERLNRAVKAWETTVALAENGRSSRAGLLRSHYETLVAQRDSSFTSGKSTRCPQEPFPISADHFCSVSMIELYHVSMKCQED